jgi:C4-dicarboxylate transporter DctM subunit
VSFRRATFASFQIYIVFLAAIAFCIFCREVVLGLPKHPLHGSVGCFKNPNGAGYIRP